MAGDEGEDLKEADRLEEAAAEWRRNGRRPDWLAGGERLRIWEAVAAKPAYQGRLESTREFLLASQEQLEDPPDNPISPWVRLIASWKTFIPVGFVIAIVFFILRPDEPQPPTGLQVNGQRGNNPEPGNDLDLGERLSLGEDIFFPGHVNKRSASNLFAKGQFKEAAEKFRHSLAERRDDPEARIYLNNALAADTDTLVIAVSVPIGASATSALVANEMLRGVAQAQQELNNNGGIHGKRLLVQIANDDNKHQIAERIAKRLVTDEKILAVLGPNASDVSRQAATVYQDRLVMISPTSFALEFENVKKLEAGNYIFMCTPNYRYLFQAHPLYVKDARKTESCCLPRLSG